MFYKLFSIAFILLQQQFIINADNNACGLIGRVETFTCFSDNIPGLLYLENSKSTTCTCKSNKEKTFTALCTGTVPELSFTDKNSKKIDDITKYCWAITLLEYTGLLVALLY